MMDIKIMFGVLSMALALLWWPSLRGLAGKCDLFRVSPVIVANRMTLSWSPLLSFRGSLEMLSTAGDGNALRESILRSTPMVRGEVLRGSPFSRR